MAAEASIATGSSPKITITGTEPVKPLPNGGAPYLNAEQAKIARILNEKYLYSTAYQELLDKINEFPSRSKAADAATMIAGYDRVSGRIAVGKSNGRINPQELHPKTVSFVEERLGVKIGEFTDFCPNRVGACAEISVADQLIRGGANPDKIQFTTALRPRETWRKPEEKFTDRAIVEPCNNCKVAWPKED